MASSFSNITKPLKDERQRQKAEKAKRKEQAGPIGTRILKFFKRWGLRLVYSAIMFLIAYLVILAGTMITPSILSYILGGLGFGGTDTQTGSVFVVSLMAGFFLTGWIFLISFIILRACWRVYIKNIRATLPEAVLERLDSLSKK
jgi:uncharacterized membrane protein